MDEFMKTTKDAGHTAELERLNAQHEVMTDAMGTLLFSPIDLSKPDLKILDSATADGRWLTDLRHSTPTPSLNTYIGTDIEPQLFPTSLPPNLSLNAQSFTDPWPAEYTATFDLVHQRLGLAGSGSFPVAKVIQNLASLGKSGGYVELVELNAKYTEGSGPVYKEFVGMMRAIFGKIGVGDFAVEMKAMLKDAGLVDVQEKRVVVKVGAIGRVELRRKGIEAMCAAVTPLVAVAKTMLPDVRGLEGLEGRLREELETRGAAYEIVVAYGRKP